MDSENLPSAPPNADTSPRHLAHTTGQVAAALLAALLLYVLSIGPAIVTLRAAGLDSSLAVMQGYDTFYTPLFTLSGWSEPFGALLGRYIDWCIQVSGQAPLDSGC